MLRTPLQRTATRAIMVVSWLAAVPMTGCLSTEPGWAPGDGDGATREEVTRVLAAQGYDVSTLQFHDDGTVVIEGDVQVPIETVLRSGAELRPKGYGTVLNGVWFTGGTAIHKPIHLINDPAAPISAAWIGAAVFGAAADWNSKVGAIFTTAPPKAGDSTVTFRKGVLRDESGRVATCEIARVGSVFPQNDSLDNTITINSEYKCTVGGLSCRKSIEQLSTAMKVRTVAHELGHVLGFRHPPSQGADFIPATLIPFTADTSSPNNRTIMRWGCVPDDADASTAVELDDICSFNMLYGCGITGKCSYLPAMPACQ